MPGEWWKSKSTERTFPQDVLTRTSADRADAERHQNIAIERNLEVAGKRAEMRLDAREELAEVRRVGAEVGDCAHADDA